MRRTAPVDNSSCKPGFITRLGLLIIAQIVFLFAAVALVIFVPERQYQSDHSTGDISQLFDDISQVLVSADSTAGATVIDSDIRSTIENKIIANPFVSSFSILRLDAENKSLFTWKASRSVPPDGRDQMETESPAISSLIQLVREMPSGYELHLADHYMVPLHFQRVDLPHQGAVVFAAEGSSDIVASPRPELIRNIILLFLTSVLVSLLIVYLLWKRFKEPLEELARRVEASAEGDVPFDSSSDVHEQEITRLAAGFNRLTDSRHRDQTTLREFGAKLDEASHALRESQQFLHTIIERSPSGTVVTDADGRILIMNVAATREFGYDGGEAVGTSVGELFALPEGAAASGQSGFETVCWRRNGQPFPAYILTAVVEDEQGRVRARLYIIRDIVESRGYQDMMVRLDRNATRGGMAADIGHEINNFLAVVLGNLELLPRSIAKGDEPGIKKKLDTMKTNVEKIARFADGLMVESPNEDVLFVSASANQIVENVIAFLRDQNRFDSVDWVVQLRPDLPMADFDDARIQQVLVNLLYNAAEAVGDIEGNHVLTVTTGTSVREGVPVIHVDVIDNGPGVQKDKESLLFKTRFTTKKKGHGFGLMTCQRILDQHGGWIGYQFENGAHFWFEIPLVHVANGTAPVDRATAVTA